MKWAKVRHFQYAFISITRFRSFIPRVKNFINTSERFVPFRTFDKYNSFYSFFIKGRKRVLKGLLGSSSFRRYGRKSRFSSNRRRMKRFLAVIQRYARRQTHGTRFLNKPR